jgi:hypothetical protein
VCNENIERYGQPPLYASPTKKPPEKKSRKINSVKGSDPDLLDSFHISIGWTLEEPNPRSMAGVKAMSKNELFQNVKRISFTVEDVKAKVGNVVTTIPLPLKLAEISNLFEV